MLEILSENENEKPIQFAGMNNYQNNGFSITLKYITSNNFRRLYRVLGMYCIKFLVKDCILIQRQKDIFIQLSGESLANLLNNSKAIAMQIKNNIRKENHKNVKNNLADLNFYFNRNSILYCLHSNGAPGLFRKSLLMRLVRFVETHFNSPQLFDLRDFPDEVIEAHSKQMNSNYRPSNQVNCASLVEDGKENKDGKTENKETQGTSNKKNKSEFEMGNSGLFKRGNEGKWKEELKLKPKKHPKREFGSSKKKGKSNSKSKKNSNRSKKSGKQKLANQTPEQKEKIYLVGGRILSEYVFKNQKRHINRETRKYLEQIFARLIKQTQKMRFEKVFYYHCSNPRNFDYRVIKHAFSKLKQMDQLDNFKKNSLKIDFFFKKKRKQFLAKSKNQNSPDIIREIESQDSPEKVIASFLDGLNRMFVPDSRVFAFVREVVSKLIPASFWGRENAQVINRYIRKMVKIKRFESFCVQDIIDDLDLFRLGFYKRKFNKFYARQIRYEKVLLLRSVLKFVFEDLVMNLLKFNFYITEKHSTHNQLFFYPKAIWYLISSIGLFELCLQNCARLPRVEASKEKLASIPLGKLRFVPKRNSLRPLMTFFKKFLNKKSTRMERISKYLQPVKIVLRSVKKLLSGEQVTTRNQRIQRVRQLPDFRQILAFFGPMACQGTSETLRGDNGYPQMLRQCQHQTTDQHDPN